MFQRRLELKRVTIRQTINRSARVPALNGKKFFDEGIYSAGGLFPSTEQNSTDLHTVVAIAIKPSQYLDLYKFEGLVV